MATVLTDPVTAPVAGERRVLIPRVDWNFYVAFREELDRQGSGSVHLTYDRGSLEVMTTGMPHEWYRKMLGHLVLMAAYEWEIEFRSGGEMTFRRQDLEKGLEPDDCWWIAHEPRMRGKADFDPHSDPPPDLAIEVEISNPLLDKPGVYAALGVPEIWRFDGRELTFWQRQDDSSYQRIETSGALSPLRPADLIPHLRLEDEAGELARLRRFVEWLRAARSQRER